MAGRLVPSALLIKAVALAVHDVPEMNGFWVDGHRGGLFLAAIERRLKEPEAL